MYQSSACKLKIKSHLLETFVIVARHMDVSRIHEARLTSGPRFSAVMITTLELDMFFLIQYQTEGTMNVIECFVSVCQSDPHTGYSRGSRTVNKKKQNGKSQTPLEAQISHDVYFSELCLPGWGHGVSGSAHTGVTLRLTHCHALLCDCSQWGALVAQLKPAKCMCGHGL